MGFCPNDKEIVIGLLRREAVDLHRLHREGGLHRHLEVEDRLNGLLRPWVMLRDCDRPRDIGPACLASTAKSDRKSGLNLISITTFSPCKVTMMEKSRKNDFKIRGRWGRGDRHGRG